MTDTSLASELEIGGVKKSFLEKYPKGWSKEELMKEAQRLLIPLDKGKTKEDIGKKILEHFSSWIANWPGKRFGYN